jgi:hypothetical protein
VAEEPTFEANGSWRGCCDEAALGHLDEVRRGGMETTADRWYHRLLVHVLVLLLSSRAHALGKSRSARVHSVVCRRACCAWPREVLETLGNCTTGMKYTIAGGARARV